MSSADELAEGAIVVALGSNLRGSYESSEALLEAALAKFETAGLHVVARSSWWKSAAWPDPAGPEYRNGVAVVETDFSPTGILDALAEIEEAFGRERGDVNVARTLDLDLIAYGRQAFRTSRLTIPHPRAAERRFVMGPLAEVLPGWRHPTLGETAEALAETAGVGRDAASTALHNQ